MRATSEELALRQAESLESVAQELFCSPEIIRQVRGRVCGQVATAPHRVE
jgi:hypothetical protein